MQTSKSFAVPCIAGLLAGLPAIVSYGATQTWGLPGGGDWFEPLNWTTQVPDATDEIAVFDDGLNGAFASISLGGQTASVGEVRQASDGTLVWLTNGDLAFDVAGIGGQAQVVTEVDAGDLTIATGVSFLDDDLVVVSAEGTAVNLSGVIAAGSQGLVMQGAGALWLSGNNAGWSGDFTANSGAVYLSHALALGVAGTSVIDGAEVYLRIGSDESFDVRTGGLWLDAGAHDGDVTLSGGDLGTVLGGQLDGTLFLSPGSGSVVGANNGRTLTLTGGVTGTGDLVFAPSGTVRLTATGLTHDGGMVVNSGRVELLAGSTHTGATTVNGGTLLVNGAGSLVGSGGSVSVEADGTLGVDRSAGSDALLNSVALNSVDLRDGSLLLQADLDPAQFLAGASTGGQLLVGSVAAYSAGATDVLDFGALPGGGALVLGASGNSSLSATLQLIPDSSRTLRLGAGTGTLSLGGVISDAGGSAVGLSHLGPGTTRLISANTFTGAVHIAGGRVEVAHTMGLGATDGDTTVAAGGRLDLSVVVSESIIIDGGQVRLAVAGSFANEWHVQSGTLESKVAGLVELAGPFEVVTGLTLRDTGGGAGISLDGAISGTGALTFEGGLFTLAGSNNYLGETTVRGGSMLDLIEVDALGDTSEGTVIQDSALVRLSVPSLEAFRVSGGTLLLADLGADYTNPVTLAGGNLSTPDLPGPGSVLLSSGLTIDGDGTLTVLDPVEFSAQVTGMGDLSVFAESDITFSGGIDLAGHLSLESADFLTVSMPQAVAVQGLLVDDYTRLVVEDDLAVSGTLRLDVVSRLDWLGGQLQTGSFEVDVQNTTIGYARFGLGIDLDLTALSNGTLIGSPVDLTGDYVGDLPGFEVFNGATVRQTADSLTVVGDVWVGVGTSPGTLRLEGGSLSADTVHIGGTTPNAIEIAGGTLHADLYLGDGVGSNGTLRLTSGQLISPVLRVGSGGTGLVEQSGGTADISSLRFGEIAGPGGVYELSGTGVLNVSELVFEEHAAGTLRVTGGTLTVTGDVEDSYAGPGTATIEISGGTFNAGGLYLRAWPNQVAYHQSGGTANFSERLEMGFNSDFQFTGGTLNATSLTVDGQDNAVLHTGGDIVADFMTLRARYNDADLRYELSGGSITTHDSMRLNATSASSQGNGDVTFVQSGGVVTSAYRFYLGTGTADGAARYELLAGTLDVSGVAPAGFVFFGDDGSAEFIQTGGTADLGELRFNNGLVRIDNGLMSMRALRIGASGPNVTSLFQQNAGTVDVIGEFTLQTARTSNVDARYQLNGGNLSAQAVVVGGEESDAVGAIEQTGGIASFGLLIITPFGNYDLTGGTLAIQDGLVSDGTLDLHGSNATFRAEGGLINLAANPLLNAANANIVGLADTVISLPAGFDTATEFGSFSNAGITHFLGDTLFIPDTTQLNASGTYHDHVQAQGDIIATASGPLHLLGGLHTIGEVEVDLGPEGTVGINNTISGMDGGTLNAKTLTVSGVGQAASFQMGGGALQLASPNMSEQNPGSLIVASGVNAPATFVLNAGSVNIPGDYHRGFIDIVASHTDALFEQHGGLVSLPDGSLRVESKSTTADAKVEIYDGSFAVRTLSIREGGRVELLGGSMQANYTTVLRSDDDDAVFRVAGGHLAGINLSLDASQTVLPAIFEMTNGLAELSGEVSIARGRVTINGGRLQAGDLSMFSPQYSEGEHYSQVIMTGGELVIDGTFNARGTSSLIDLSGGLLQAGILRLAGEGDEVFLRLDSPGVRVRVTDRFILGEDLVLDAVQAATIHLDTASMEMQSTSAADMAGLEQLTLLMEGNADIEVGGRDMGAVLAGFDNNFALSELVLGDDQIGLVRLVDETDNALADSQDEALYVDRLVLGAGSGLNLNGLNLYYHQFIDEGGLILPEGGALIHVPLDVLGDLSGDDYVGVEDLDIIMANWGGSVTPGDLSLGDVSGDGLVGSSDLSIVIANWGQGITPQGNVPEPTAALTLLLGTFLLSRRRRTELHA